jgi:uncharacterized membrane protein YdjX (TVP38/TMEM64 family)
MTTKTASRLSLGLLLTLMAAGTGLALWFGLDAEMALELLRQHHAWLMAFVTSKPILAALLFMAIYAVAVAASVPGLAVLTIAGGLLFGWVYGTLFTLIAATTAGALVFLLARSALGAPLRERAGPAIKRFTENFRESALSYVFVLHLVPVLPYVVVITIPAACGVSLRVYVVSAFCGILPATALLAYVGAGVGEVLLRSGPVELAHLLTPQITACLVVLALLALLPVGYRMVRRAA